MTSNEQWLSAASLAALLTGDVGDLRVLSSALRRRPATSSHLAPLDPVTVAGVLDIITVKRWCKEARASLVWASTLGTLLGREILTVLQPDRALVVTELAPIAARFDPHLAELRHAHVLADGSHTDRSIIAGYFEVPKADGSSRAIIDARPANEVCAKPPTVGLPHLPNLYRLLESFTDPWFASVDLRHWFFQIRLAEAARPLFTMTTGSGCWSPAVWPMGFKWSPFVAQATAWLLVIRGIGYAGFAVATQEHLTPYVYQQTETESFLVTVFYDNILLVASSSTLFDSLAVGIDRAFSAVNAVWKGAATENAKNFIASSKASGSVTYVGAELGWSPKFSVRLPAAQVNKWAGISTPTTLGELRSFLGRAVWWCTITARPLWPLRPPLRLLAAYASDENPDQPTPGERIAQDVADIVQQVRVNTPRCVASAPASWHIISSDASLLSAGYLFVPDAGDNEAHHVTFGAHLWNADDARAIYLKEIEAAIIALEQFTGVGPTMVLVDNTVAVSILTKEFSMVEETWPLIERWQSAKRGRDVAVRWVPTLLQPADLPSRGQSPFSVPMTQPPTLRPEVSAAVAHARTVAW